MTEFINEMNYGKIRDIFSFIFRCVISIYHKDTWKSLTPCDVLLICHDNDRGYNFENKAYAQYIDSIGDILIRNKINVKSVAKPFSSLVGSRAYGNPISINRTRLFIAIQGVVSHIFKLRKFEKWGNKEDIIKLWIKILELSSPKVIIAIQPEKTLCYLCNKLNKQIIDLQHGVISKNDNYYNIKNNVQEEFNNYPSIYFCWDKSSFTILEGILPPEKKIKEIGNPWLNRFKNTSKNDALVNQAIIHKNKIKNNKPTILVSLHRAIQQEYIKNKNSESFNSAVTLEKIILKTHQDYNWLLRLHPVQLRGWQYKTVLKNLYNKYGHIKNIDWEICSITPLPIVLQWTDLHITHHSSVTIEAASMGIPTALIAPHIFCKNKFPDLFAYEREIGIAEIINVQVDEIENWIIKNKEKKRNVLSQNRNDKIILESILPFLNSNHE